MQSLRLVSALFLAPLASAAVVGVALLAANVDMSGPQDDGKYLPTLPQILAPTYLIALVLSITAYFLVSRLNWTSLRQITLIGAIPLPVAWICLTFALSRDFHPRRILIGLLLMLAGAAWGLTFWWLLYRPREEPSSFPKPPLQRE